MFIVCWSVKGGAGTTVVASALATSLARHSPVTLVDLGGDAPVVLGAAPPSGPGIADWLAAHDPPADALGRLATSLHDHLGLVHADAPVAVATERWPLLVAAGGALAGHVIVDAGRNVPPRGADVTSLLVLRSTYATVRRCVTSAADADGLVVVHEPGHSLRARDIEHALGRPVLAEVPLDPAVVRATELGLLHARLPISITTPLRSLLRQAAAR